MKEKRLSVRNRVLIAIGLAAAALFTVFLLRLRDTEDDYGNQLLGVLDTEELSDSTGTLRLGYCYHLLTKFASDNRKEIRIVLADKAEDYEDSLNSGTACLIVRSFPFHPDTDSAVVSSPLDSIAVWVAGTSRKKLMDDVNKWIEEWNNSSDRAAVREIFLEKYSPFKFGEIKCLSPYDSLLRIYADSTGNDWRLLASVMYKESRFLLEAKSGKGAVGLMQMKPSTAAEFGITDLSDPEQSIYAGAHYIQRISRHYRKGAADKDELIKFTLAAYNAGMSRIDDCIRYAAFHNADTSRWDSVAAVIPKMRDSTALASGLLEHGAFNGQETLQYVEKTTELYRQFSRMFPER